jgi:hypothetical protein
MQQVLVTKVSDFLSNNASYKPKIKKRIKNSITFILSYLRLYFFTILIKFYLCTGTSFIIIKCTVFSFPLETIGISPSLNYTAIIYHELFSKIK